jgi:hypothetical protein
MIIVNRLNVLLTAVASLLAMSFVLPHANAQLIIGDDFSASELNTNVWSVAMPFCDSQMYQSNGAALFVNRGRLLTKAPLPMQFEIQGQFQLTGSSHDQFALFLRTDGAVAAPGTFCNGITAQFQIRSGDQGQEGVNNVGLFDSATAKYVGASFPLVMNSPYVFRIVDNATNIVLYLSDTNTPLVTLNTINRSGSLLGIQNREGDCGGSSISAGSVTQLDYIYAVDVPPFLSIETAAVRLRWFAESNSTYQIQWSADSQSWSNATLLVGGGTETNYVEWTDGPRKLYRVIKKEDNSTPPGLD